MKCPGCGSPDTFTINSRPDLEGYSRRRRYECPDCKTRFSTKEFIVSEENKDLLAKLKDIAENQFCGENAKPGQDRIRLPEEREVKYVKCLGCKGSGEYNGTDIISGRLVVLKCGVCHGTGKMPI